MDEKKQIKKQLNKELANLHFTKQKAVLNQLQKPSLKQKLNQLWNKEVSIPILPVSSIFAILLFGYGFFNLYDSNPQIEDKKLIKIGSSAYWKDQIEGRLANED